MSDRRAGKPRLSLVAPPSQRRDTFSYDAMIRFKTEAVESRKTIRLLRETINRTDAFSQLLFWYYLAVTEKIGDQRPLLQIVSRLGDETFAGVYAEMVERYGPKGR